ncbi:MAG: YceI family protein, partial [bacterium]|nr:YceI family protein [bacterium]
MRIALALLAAVLQAAWAEPAVYQIGPAEGSRFALEVDKTGLLSGKTHLFEFSRYSGEIRYDAGQPADSRIRLVIESGSVECKDDWVSAKDLAKIQRHAVDKMLAVARYPELVFVSEKVTPRGAGEFLVEGQLTIRETTRPAKVNVRMDSSHAGALGFDGSATVAMKDYGLKPPKAALGLKKKKNEM